MSLNIGYMGTKRFLAPHVKSVIGTCADGAVVDVFSGMGAVAASLADYRPVWVNDAQMFSHEAGKALFTSQKSLPDLKRVERLLTDHFYENQYKLNCRFRSLVASERAALVDGSAQALTAISLAITERMESAFVNRERLALAAQVDANPYRLFTLAYSGRFFSLSQAIEIDSLKYAVDSAYDSCRSAETKRWLNIAIGVAMLRVASSTGHFAQYLTPNDSNFRYLTSQRKRSVFSAFWLELRGLEPVGSSEWRKSNRAFCGDATSLLQRLFLFGERPAVVYADPPYTDDQYSRFYHLWETLIHYDYPVSTGKGCYRPGRFQTPFALKSKVEFAIESLAFAAKSLGADLVLSYPANGLLSEVSKRVEEVVGRHYPDCERVVSLDHKHSTMGASKGSASTDVTEIIYLARNRI
jgi:adenine-specific DNA-methyltransferase